MIIFEFTKYGEKKFGKLTKETQKRIIQKFQELKAHEDIFSVLKKLHDVIPATHRLRIGNYRLILELIIQNKEEIKFRILDAGHRKEIYR